MINSLDIKNYRNLNELKINSLGRLNLITGKNNTGKSTLLEAIAIYATKGDFNQIYQLLIERGEYFKRADETKNPTESNLKVLSSLFSDRLINFQQENSISIGHIENTLLGEDQSLENTVFIRFVKYIEDIIRENEVTSRKKTILENDSENQNANIKIGLQVKSSKNSYIISLDEDRPLRYIFRGLGINDSIQFIRTRNIDREINVKLWDNITLTEKEQYVIDALKIIEPTTERIAFIEENRKERTAVIKLSTATNIIPLQSMGDGMNRILTIILALVNADNGFLLIDEFENGLHYSVQEQLWKIIFNLAEKLNVQVFITTHSEDCIAGFENIVNSPDNKLEGKLIRLDNINGIIRQVEFGASDLKIATDNNIEIR